jgi:hypothetical protein
VVEDTSTAAALTARALERARESGRNNILVGWIAIGEVRPGQLGSVARGKR